MAASEMVEETLAALSSKQAAFLAAADGLTTLVIGSSHGDYAFDPALCPGSFNFCGSSQDLKHSALLYRYCAERAVSLKHVVVFYSLFSPGFMLEKTSDRPRCAVYKHLFAPYTPYANAEINEIYDEISRRPAQTFTDPGDFADAGFLRSNDRHFFPPVPQYGPEVRTADHLKHNARGDADIYLVKILDMADRMGHRVTIVLPPARFDYKVCIRQSSDQLFRGIVELKNHFDYDFDFINFFDDTDVLDAYFGDCDHLLPEGPGVRIVSEGIAALLRAQAG
jgi:hypothetical protein